MEKQIKLSAFLSFWGATLFAQNVTQSGISFTIDSHYIDMILNLGKMLIVSFVLAILGRIIIKASRSVQQKFNELLKFILVLVVFILLLVPVFVFIMSYSTGRNDYVQEFLNLCVSVYPGTISILKDLDKEKSNIDKGSNIQVTGDINGDKNKVNSIVINNKDGNIQIGEKNRNE